MTPLDLVRLTPLMDRTQGIPAVTVGLIDGPVTMNHADLAHARIRQVPGAIEGACSRVGSEACRHGTFVAGILCADRESVAPAICPGCTIIVRPVFAEALPNGEDLPGTTPKQLATAIVDCIEAGAGIINLSLALVRSSSNGEPELNGALDLAARRGVIVVAAAGNQGIVGSSAATRHPWVIPVVACDLQGRPAHQTNLGGSLGRRGFRAPDEGVTSLGSEGRPLTFGGTSVAAPFVTGTVALLWSEFPGVTAAEIKTAIDTARASNRLSIVPPLLDAWGAFTSLSVMPVRRRIA